VHDIPVLVGNEDLKPETATTYDAQIFYDDQKTFAAVTFFDSTINDLIIRDSSVSPASFKNGGEQHFQGVELEGKRFLTSHWQLLGSTLYQDNKETDDLNPSTAPEYMIKLGTGYVWDWGTASIFCSHFGKPPRLDSEVVVNPEPAALTLLSATLRLDLAHWLAVPKGRATMMFRVENLLDEDIWVTEFNRGGNPNSLPDGPGRTFYAGLTYKF
jgi:outer membrane receptor protein involved in Fe transport